MIRDTIALGRKVEQFLSDPAVEGLFDQLDQSAFARFKQAETDEELRRAGAYSRALDDVKAALRGAVEDGHLAAESRIQD